MRLCVIDGRGGGLGKRLIEGLLAQNDQQDVIIGLGLNEAAADAMWSAGAKFVGVGEHAIQNAVPAADIILASLNVILPGSMLGEVTPRIADVILRAPGRKLLLPVNRAKVEIMGVEFLTLESLIQYALQRVHTLQSPTAPA